LAPGLAVGLVLGAADVRADSLGAARALDGGVADAHSLVERLKDWHTSLLEYGSGQGILKGEVSLYH